MPCMRCQDVKTEGEACYSSRPGLRREMVKAQPELRSDSKVVEFEVVVTELVSQAFFLETLLSTTTHLCKALFL